MCAILMPLSKGHFSLDVSSPRGPGRADGFNNYLKMQCSMTSAALSIFGADLKIALTGVRRQSFRKSLAMYRLFLIFFFDITLLV